MQMFLFCDMHFFWKSGTVLIAQYSPALRFVMLCFVFAPVRFSWPGRQNYLGCRAEETC